MHHQACGSSDHSTAHQQAGDFIKHRDSQPFPKDKRSHSLCHCYDYAHMGVLHISNICKSKNGAFAIFSAFTLPIEAGKTYHLGLNRNRLPLQKRIRYYHFIQVSFLLNLRSQIANFLPLFSIFFQECK